MENLHWRCKDRQLKTMRQSSFPEVRIRKGTESTQYTVVAYQDKPFSKEEIACKTILRFQVACFSNNVLSALSYLLYVVTHTSYLSQAPQAVPV